VVEEDVNIAADYPLFEVKDELMDHVFETKMRMCEGRIVWSHMSQERITKGENVSCIDQRDNCV
jgi:hypothetical protein